MKDQGRTGGGAWPWRRGQRWMVTGKRSDASAGRSGPLSALVSFDKDPETRATDTFKAEHVTRRDQEGQRGVRGHRLWKSAPLRPALLTCVSLLCLVS